MPGAQFFKDLGIAYSVLGFILSLVGSFHVLTYKKDPRAALGWIGIMWLNGPIGLALYFFFGINRVRRRAKLQRLERSTITPETEGACKIPDVDLIALQTTGDRVNNRKLQNGNAIEILVNGDEAYPRMLEAIASARSTIILSTYIFDRGAIATQFVTALKDAKARGVHIRVLIDDLGLRYSRPTILSLLKSVGVPVATFQPLFRLQGFATLNLRNHRKSLVIDGAIGFTGGMNIRDGHCLGLDPSQSASLQTDSIQDLHFRITGPVASQIQAEFIRDWAYTTGEYLGESSPFGLDPRQHPTSRAERVRSEMNLLEGARQTNSDICARVVADGPDEDYERVRWLLMGALSVAKKRVNIVTPYFVPDQILISSMISASLRGVQISVLLPEKSNLPWVQWASNALLWQLLQKGIHVFLQAPPFDHSKFITVDGQWSLIGSTNIDPRSLRLNFELNVEIFNAEFSERMDRIFGEKKMRSRALSLKDLDQRPRLVRARDGIARLLSPYL